MSRLRSILLLVCVVSVSSQESTTTSVQDNPSLSYVRDELRDLKVLIAQQNTRIAQQDTKFSDVNTKMAEQECTIKDLKMEIERLENGESNLTTKEANNIFTRWGGRDCPETVSQLVYSGIAGGSHFTHTGGAAEYVCLPPDPIWNTNKHYTGQNWGYMYGTEYQQIPQRVMNFKVPCAVCRTTQYSTVLMIPARTQCYPGWQKAYHGELVSGKHDHDAPSQYVCLDDDPQTNGTNKSEDDKLMYPVRAKCGALPCPPYEDNTLLTCVVCLK